MGNFRNPKLEGFSILNKYLEENHNKFNSREVAYYILPFVYTLKGRVSKDLINYTVEETTKELSSANEKGGLIPKLNILSALSGLTQKIPLSPLNENDAESINISANFLGKIIQRAVQNKNNFFGYWLIDNIIPLYVNRCFNEPVNIQTRMFLNILMLTNTFPNKRVKDIEAIFENIVSKIEEFDSGAIINMVKSMNYFNQNNKAKFDFLEKINEMIFATVISSGENVRADFLVNYLSNFKNFSKVLKQEHLVTYSELYLRKSELEKKVFGNYVLLNTIRLTNSDLPEIVEKLTRDIIKNTNNFNFRDVSIELFASTKRLISANEALYEDYRNALNHKILNQIKTVESPIYGLELLTLADVLSLNGETEPQILDRFIDLINKPLNPGISLRLLEDYIHNQEKRGIQTKIAFMKNFLKNVNLELIKEYNIGFIFCLSDLMVLKSEEKVREDVNKIIDSYLDAKKQTLLYDMFRYLSNSTNHISDSGLLKIALYLRSLAENKESAANHNINSKLLLMSVSKILKNVNKKEISNRIISIYINLAETLSENHIICDASLDFLTTLGFDLRENNLNSQALVCTIYELLLKEKPDIKEKQTINSIFLVLTSNRISSENKLSLFKTLIGSGILFF